MRLGKSSLSSFWRSYSITPADYDHDDEYGIFMLRTTAQATWMSHKPKNGSSNNRGDAERNRDKT